VSFSATDDLSGVAATWYRVGEGATTTAPASFTALEGSTTVRYWSVDSVGNVETSRTATVRVDLTDPFTTPAGVPGGWVSADRTVTLSAVDDLSGVASIKYTLNGGTEQTYGSGIPVTSEGTNTLRFAAIDAAGNRETSKTATILIDKSPPVTTTKVPVESMYWGPASIDLLASDSHSGVAGTAWRDDGSPEESGTVAWIDTVGTHILSFHSHDFAGNEEGLVTRTVLVTPESSDPPLSLEATASQPKPGAEIAWTFSSSNHTGFELQRSTDGVDWSHLETCGPTETTFTDATATDWYARYYYRVRSYTPRTIAFPGTATWTTASGYVRLADAPPFTQARVGATLYPDSGTTVWLASSEVTVPRAPDVSDASIWCSVDSSPVADCAVPFRVSGEGAHEVRYMATALNHERETTRTLSLGLDTTAPRTTANVGLLVSQPTLALTAIDPQSALGERLSGVGATWYSFDGAAETLYDPAAPPAVPRGIHTVSWHSHDVAGNQERSQSGTIICGPQASVSTPKGSSSTRVRRTLTFSGKMTRATNHRRLTLLAYRFDGADWILTRTKSVQVHTPRRGLTTYRGAIKFTAKGSWKVVARYEGDSYWVASYSAPKYVRVR
jgi:hypothetical protein